MLKVLIALLFMTNVFAEDSSESESKEVVVKDEKSRVKLYLIGDYITVASPSGGDALSGIGMSFQGQFALTESYAVNVSVRQNFSFAGESIITSFDGRFTYALTGKLIGTDRVTKINGTKVADVKDYDLSGFRLQLIASQYYFNASTTTVPYNGMGLSAYYETTSKSRYNYIYGARFDQISNSGLSTSPLSVFAGVGFNF